MLRELSIKNFIIIDNLHISFSGGLTILSGETGAGKSIIINAVNLLLGSRATSKFIRTGSDSAEVEALFEISKKSKIMDMLKQYGFDTSEGLLIRRIISRKDRHRIYINGHLATIQMLNIITENIASISGQHAHQGLLKEERHLIVLDQFGGLTPLREEVYSYYHEIVPLIRKVSQLNTLKDKQGEHIKLLEFQKKEIIEASTTPNEDATLEQERLRLKNGEELYRLAHTSVDELYSAQGAIVERLVEVKKNLQKACRIDKGLLSKAERISETTFNIQDVAEELRTYIDNIQIDEKRLEEVEERLDMLSKLKRKYGGSLEAVLSYLESIDKEISGIENISVKIKETEDIISKLYNRIAKASTDLSAKRKQTAKILAAKLEKELGTLEMSHAKFQISLQTMPAESNSDPHLIIDGNIINETGIDRAAFMIAPNVGEALKPLSGIVSGGELSRIVLALKAILAKTESVETLVFDEVDAGIGGKVAEVVGKKLSTLADYHQVICITHLPQIAKFGNHHFRISKSVSCGRTKTSINRLNKEERIKELARMLGGVKITKTTLDHARELLASLKTAE